MREAFRNNLCNKSQCLLVFVTQTNLIFTDEIREHKSQLCGENGRAIERELMNINEVQLKLIGEPN